MVKKIIDKLKVISHSHWYWLSYIVSGIALLSVALFYQYVFDEQPCVMCIQVRLWISLFIILSIGCLWYRKNRLLNSATHVSMVLIAAGLADRSYQLLGTERGFIEGSCSFDIGLPAWFAIQDWLPWVYRVETSCGYTPELLFGITMAEGLMLLSVCMLLISFLVACASLLRTRD